MYDYKAGTPLTCGGHFNQWRSDDRRQVCRNFAVGLAITLVVLGSLFSTLATR